MTSLRPYQIDVIARTQAAIAAGQRRIILVAPTGAGKTVIAGAIVKSAVESGQRVLFLAHRRELIKQTSRKLYDVDLDHGIIQAGFPMRLAERVQVGSIQTLHARAIRGASIGLPDADLVIIDEAHHSRATTYQKIIDRFPNSVILGLTATPCRGDGLGLGNIFDAMVECPPVQDLIDLGFLVPTKVFAPSIPDLKGVKTAMGDYVETQLAERMDQPKLVGDIVEQWFRHGERRRTVCFATGVAHSVHIRDRFREASVMAEHIDGTTPVEERDRILADLASGKIDLITNCMVLTEGVDIPDISCLILARPTKSLGLFRQMIGRGLRPAPGKADMIVLDHSGAVFQHGFAEDPIEWKLSEDHRAVNPAQMNGVGTHKGRELKTCPECSAVRYQGQPCPACGWRPQPKAAPIEVQAGDLNAVTRGRKVLPTDWTPETMRDFHNQLAHIGIQRGYKPGWAAFKYKERFGDWPKTRNPTPQPACDAVLAWVRAQQRAYAKSFSRPAEMAA